MSSFTLAPYFRCTLIVSAVAAAMPVMAQTGAAPATTLGEVVVSASADASAEGLTKPYAGGQVARGGRVGILGNQDMMDTPFSGTAYTNELIQNQQAKSVADVLQNDPTVRVARGFGNFQELYVIRGFPVYSDDVAYNGLYGMLPRQYVATELVERVEVFRGASAFLNGAAPGGSGIGGAINLLPKRATNEPLNQVTVGVESGGQAYLAADLARRFGPDQATGVRFNAVRRDGETSVENEKRELSVLALGLDWRSRDVRLSADLGYQDHKLKQPRPSVTPTGGIPSAPDASKNFSQPWTYSNEKQTFATFRGEVDLNDKVTAWGAFGVRKGEEANVLSNPSSDANGNTTAYRFDNKREEVAKTLEVGMRGKVATGAVNHTLIASATAFSLEKKNAYAFSSFAGFPSSIYSPVDVPAPPATALVGGNLDDPLKQATTDTSSFAIADTMGFMKDTVLVTLGLRHQTIRSRTFDYNSGAETASYKKDEVTPVAGLVVKINPAMSAYANYVEALVEGPTAPMTSGGAAVTNGGTVFAPYTSKQKEIGFKYDAGRFGAGVALFTTERPSGIVDNGVYSIDGEQRNRGIELTMFGEAQKGLRLLGGVTFLDAELVKTADGTNDGRSVIGVPDRQANVGVEWDVPGVRGLTLNGLAVYTSSQYASLDNSLSIPSWTRYDIGARYITTIGGKLVTWRAKINNVAGRDYWASVGGASVDNNYMVLGAPRTAMLSASVEF